MKRGQLVPQICDSCFLHFNVLSEPRYLCKKVSKSNTNTSVQLYRWLVIANLLSTLLQLRRQRRATCHLSHQSQTRDVIIITFTISASVAHKHSRSRCDNVVARAPVNTLSRSRYNSPTTTATVCVYPVRANAADLNW